MIRPILVITLGLVTLVQDQKPAWRKRLEEFSATAEAWQKRKAEIRQRILVSAGLWPEFDRPALKPVIFGKIEREDYTVEKVYVETLPGFYLTGNLYRPLGKTGPFPGVLCTHGHWSDGRYANEQACSVSGRAISFARLGFIAFSYDMVGYGDLKQVPHHFQDLEWSINLFGLQTWNSLRALDFLASLPDVDPKRLGCTGESGGGTQTFILTAIDDRVACSAPVCMVAAEFQGGCECENAPFLRIDLNNVEIAAATSPRPLILVSATGDWTANNPKLEGPAIERVYKSLGCPEKYRGVQFKAGHNYNKDSREVVYAWFARWLQGAKEAERIAEPEFKMEKRAGLAVFGGDHKLPEGAVNADGLRRVMRERIVRQLEELAPKDAASLKKFREVMIPALNHTLAVKRPDLVQRDGPPRTLFVAIRAEDLKPFEGIGQSLTLKSHEKETPSGGTPEQRAAFRATYFRNATEWQVQDILDRLAVFEGPTRLVGIGEAGLAVLLASVLTEAPVNLTLVDLTSITDPPGMARFGGWKTAAMIVPSGKLILHGQAFDPAPLQAAFKAAGREDALVISDKAWPAEKILDALR